jgi:hypothetical protein
MQKKILIKTIAISNKNDYCIAGKKPLLNNLMCFFINIKGHEQDNVGCELWR